MRKGRTKPERKLYSGVESKENRGETKGWVRPHLIHIDEGKVGKKADVKRKANARPAWPQVGTKESTRGGGQSAMRARLKKKQAC